MFQFQKNIFISFFLLTILFTSSCAELDSHDKSYRFNDSITLYKNSLRWGQWTNLIQLQRPEPEADNTDFEDPAQYSLIKLKKIKVTHIEDIGTQMDPNERNAKTIFLIEFHFDNSSVITSIHHTVNWWYDEENNLWFTNTALPKEFKLAEKQLKTIKLSPQKN